jgi:branched-chain amino acid transport system substrate-binding protein
MGFLASAETYGLAAERKAGGPVYIGEVVPLTGPDAGPAAGLYEQDGVTLAIRQINARGGINGRPLQVIRADDRSTPAGAIAAFGRLVRSSRITAVIATSTGFINQAMAPSIKKAGIPVMIGGGAGILTHEGDPWVFCTGHSEAYTARALSTFTVETLHLTGVAVLHSDNVSQNFANAQLLADLKSLGVTPVIDQVMPRNATDLTAQVLAIKKSGARALISLSTGFEDLPLLGRQMRQAGVHLTWLGNVNLGVKEVRRQGGALFYGTYVVTQYAPGQSSEALAFDRYSRATLHLPGDFGSAYANDGVQILAKVMRQVGTRPQAIRRGILAIRGYRGAMGTYNFDRNGESLCQATVVQNIHGRRHVVKVLSF